jgi:hypothetical protein
MMDDLRFTISSRIESARNFDGGVSPRRFQVNAQGNGAAISPSIKSAISHHQS